MNPINICNVEGVTLAADTASETLSLGRYDVYAEELSVIRVGHANKMAGLTETNGYVVPAGAVIPMIVDQPNMVIKGTTAILVHKVGDL